MFIQWVPLLVIATIIGLVILVAVRTSGPREDGTEPSGIGGWLILPAIALVITPLVNIVGVVQAANLLGDAVIVPGLQTVLLIEIAGIVALTLGFVFVATRFFRRRVGTPRLFISLLVANLLFILADAAIVGATLSLPVFDTQTGTGIVRAVIYAAIWVPYMLRSVRVRNTFVVP